MSEVLEICCDASMRKFNDTERIFTCSGAICINTMEEQYVITPDSTNNRGELFAVYLGIKLAEKIMLEYPGRFSRINLYSDSKFSIYGLKTWMPNWLATQDANGIIYGSNREPVKNQELFMMIITYLVTHNMVINFHHQKGHVNTNSSKALANANRVFKDSNGFWLKPEDVFKISFYNDIVDKNSRKQLDYIDQSQYPIMQYSEDNVQMCRFQIPLNYRDFVR